MNWQFKNMGKEKMVDEEEESEDECEKYKREVVVMPISRQKKWKHDPS